MRSHGLFAIIAILLVSNLAQADLMKDFDSLGGNDVLLDRAQALNPEAQIRVVQDRIVKRRWRHEFAPEASTVLGGDSYNTTQNLGLNYHLHISPRWSVGAKYNHAFNKLRSEGDHLINDTSGDGRGMIPEIDHPKSQYMGLVNWYPIYGKMNLYDLGVVHFDIYALGGYGKITLKSGETDTWTAGGGIGFWFSQHLTTRLEMRFQEYQAQRYPGGSNMQLTIASIQVGYLL